jgi:hypothetical protein
MSLMSFHEINFEGVQDHTEGGKSATTLMLHMDMPSRDLRVKQMKMIFTHLQSYRISKASH